VYTPLHCAHLPAWTTPALNAHPHNVYPHTLSRCAGCGDIHMFTPLFSRMHGLCLPAYRAYNRWFRCRCAYSLTPAAPALRGPYSLPVSRGHGSELERAPGRMPPSIFFRQHIAATVCLPASNSWTAPRTLATPSTTHKRCGEPPHDAPLGHISGWRQQRACARCAQAAVPATYNQTGSLYFFASTGWRRLPLRTALARACLRHSYPPCCRHRDKPSCMMPVNIASRGALGARAAFHYLLDARLTSAAYSTHFNAAHCHSHPHPTSHTTLPTASRYHLSRHVGRREEPRRPAQRASSLLATLSWANIFRRFDRYSWFLHRASYGIFCARDRRARAYATSTGRRVVRTDRKTSIWRPP